MNNIVNSENSMIDSIFPCRLMNKAICTVNCEFTSYSGWVGHIVNVFSEIGKQRNTLYFVGNGGSAAIAIHMTADYLKNACIRTRSMHDPAVLTCLGNDYGYEYIFSKQLEIVADPGDVLVAISSSGNSSNIVNAVRMAKEKSCIVVTLSGFRKDNAIRQMGDYNLYVPSMKYGTVESIHNAVLQQIVDFLKEGRQDG